MNPFSRFELEEASEFLHPVGGAAAVRASANMEDEDDYQVMEYGLFDTAFSWKMNLFFCSCRPLRT